jgi:hypothetical protein
MYVEHQRGSPRLDVVLQARCRFGTNACVPVMVYDLSVGGCRIARPGHSLRVGDTVIVRTDILEGLTGQVRWVDLDHAGVCFDRPLYGPVVEHIHYKWSGFLQSIERPKPSPLRMVA